MADQVIQGRLDIEGPGLGTPFNVLTINAGTFGNRDNLTKSYFIIASDIGAAPPNGEVKFSVRGDGLLTAPFIESPTINNLQAQIIQLEENVALLQRQAAYLLAATWDALPADLRGPVSPSDLHL
jgi:hypothetical protein